MEYAFRRAETNIANCIGKLVLLADKKICESDQMVRDALSGGGGIVILKIIQERSPDWKVV